MTETRSLSLRERIEALPHSHFCAGNYATISGDNQRCDCGRDATVADALRALTDAERSPSWIVCASPEDEIAVAVRVLNDHDMTEEADALLRRSTKSAAAAIHLPRQPTEDVSATAPEKAGEAHDWRWDEVFNVPRCNRCLVRGDKAHGPICLKREAI